MGKEKDKKVEEFIAEQTRESLVLQAYDLGHSVGYAKGYVALLYELFDIIPFELAREKYDKAIELFDGVKELRKETFKDETPKN